jgi:la-related protein 1
MDSQGWIPISLIASFNRVKCLTADPYLVKEVLVLSSMVEVRDDWVRMVGWEQFVLPDAVTSSVESSLYTLESDMSLAGEDEVDGDVDVEEDEDEEVVFVMDRQAQSWSPERRQV